MFHHTRASCPCPCSHALNSEMGVPTFFHPVADLVKRKSLTNRLELPPSPPLRLAALWTSQCKRSRPQHGYVPRVLSRAPAPRATQGPKTPQANAVRLSELITCAFCSTGRVQHAWLQLGLHTPGKSLQQARRATHNDVGLKDRGCTGILFLRRLVHSRTPFGHLCIAWYSIAPCISAQSYSVRTPAHSMVQHSAMHHAQAYPGRKHQAMRHFELTSTCTQMRL